VADVLPMMRPHATRYRALLIEVGPDIGKAVEINHNSDRSQFCCCRCFSALIIIEQTCASNKE